MGHLVRHTGRSGSPSPKLSCIYGRNNLSGGHTGRSGRPSPKLKCICGRNNLSGGHTGRNGRSSPKLNCICGRNNLSGRGCSGLRRSRERRSPLRLSGHGSTEIVVSSDGVAAKTLDLLLVAFCAIRTALEDEFCASRKFTDTVAGGDASNNYALCGIKYARHETHSRWDLEHHWLPWNVALVQPGYLQILWLLWPTAASLSLTFVVLLA
jgi:hypothetical protein